MADNGIASNGQMGKGPSKGLHVELPAARGELNGGSVTTNGAPSGVGAPQRPAYKSGKVLQGALLGALQSHRLKGDHGNGKPGKKFGRQ